MTPGKPETGAALINVLILVGILSVLATGMIDRLRLAQRLQINVAAQEQARSGMAAAETLLLDRMRSPGAMLAALGQPLTLALPQGRIDARISDAGTCFNLNSLAVGTSGSFAARPLAVAQFARLMTLAGVADDKARSVAAATADWIDSDDTPGPGGAEDAAYARAIIPYRTGGTLMAETSEWRAVAGVNTDVHARVRPLLCALPEAELSRINVNALVPAQAPLLAMLTGSSSDGARAVIAARPRGGWKSRDAFWASPALAQARPPADALGQVIVSPAFAVLDIGIIAAGASAQQGTLVRVGEAGAAVGSAIAGRPRILARRWSPEE
ncbi:type II secretion system minor pseudopilin GspK [Sandarakinorhabdus sp.]|uniref:type II secretion system minor pseudopilin GspK n=1 Tax=Sandarakinorhabdus sp. TaxID=1916663 RepID=UPI00286DB6A4|nr:type II secretion system minor pseudopilin GspK [Sandarakinorhabdus sp.]